MYSDSRTAVDCPHAHSNEHPEPDMELCDTLRACVKIPKSLIFTIKIFPSAPLRWLQAVLSRFEQMYLLPDSDTVGDLSYYLSP